MDEPLILAIKETADCQALAAILVKYSYTVRIGKKKYPGSGTPAKVLIITREE